MVTILPLPIVNTYREWTVHYILGCLDIEERISHSLTSAFLFIVFGLFCTFLHIGNIDIKSGPPTKGCKTTLPCIGLSDNDSKLCTNVKFVKGKKYHKHMKNTLTY